MSADLDTVENTSRMGWVFESKRKTLIQTTARDDEICSELEVSHLPDQLFEDCYLKIESKELGVKFHFNAFDAIKAAKVSEEEAENDVKCMYHDTWKKKKGVKTFYTGLHWTYDVQKYTGLVSDQEIKEGGHIDMGLLQDTTQPILHFTASDLFEDDLDDCGTSKLSLKFRCMPTCWFVLLRQFIRVDRVQVIVKDVRWFHEFGSDEVSLELITRKQQISDMANSEMAAAHTPESSPLKLYNDPDKLAQTLPIDSHEKLKINLC